MSGLPAYNFPEFNRVADLLRKRGVVVINPAETAGGVHHLPRQWYFKFDFSVIAAVEAIYALPGWAHSKGANAEAIYASELGLPIYQLDDDGNILGVIRVNNWSIELVSAFEDVVPTAWGASKVPQLREPEYIPAAYVFSHLEDKA